MCKITACENTEGAFFILLQTLILETILGGQRGVISHGWFVILSWGLYYWYCRMCLYETCPVDRLFNPQDTILTLPSQDIVLIVVHWIFHNIMIIRVKVFYCIILMVLLIVIIGCWCFCGTHRGFSLMSDLLTNLHNVGICWNQLQLEFPWSSGVTNGLECYILFRIPNFESGFASSLEYI